MEELLFSKNHTWILKGKNESVKIGISEYAQEKLGAIVFINLPEVGDSLSMDESLGDVESIKTVSDIISPLDGEVIQVNDVLTDAPESINLDPYGSWLLEARVEKVADDLMNVSEYADYLEQL